MEFKKIVLAVISLGIFCACQPKIEENNVPIKEDNSDFEYNVDYQFSENAELRAVADSILFLIENKETKELEKKFVGTANIKDRKIIFSPYAYIDSSKFQNLDFANFDNENMELVWGTTDGSGAEIRMSPPKYLTTYIIETKFSKAPSVNVNKAMGRGNSLDNTKNFFPEAQFVEYYYPMFNPKYEGMDWQSLRVYLKKSEGKFILVGLVNDRWTI